MPGTAIAFFNNKGGVGKTTLACNFASYASKQGYSATVIDCDPQANATQLLLTEEDWESIYASEDRGESSSILEPLKNIRDGDSSIYPHIPTKKSSRFDVDVLPGHPSLAQIEDIFSASWIDFKGGTTGAARRTLWVRYLLQHISTDLVVYDLSPSLGALNRSVLIGADFFITPVEADLFSLYALANIGTWMNKWSDEFLRAVENYKGQPVHANLESALRIREGWLGYTVQQYVSRTKNGVVRDVKAYEKYKAQIPETSKTLEAFRSNHAKTLDLGIVPHMFSMIPIAQTAHSPIADLQQADGLRGGQPGQRDKYTEQLDVIFEAILKNAGINNA